MTTASLPSPAPTSEPPRLALLASAQPGELPPAIALLEAQRAGDAMIHVRGVNTASPREARHRAALLSVETARHPLRGPAALTAAPRPVAFMFPGLGDHYLGMGLGLYRSLPVFRDAIDECAARIQPELGVDLRDVMYAESEPAVAGLRPAGLDLRRMLGRDPVARSPAEARLDEIRHAHSALFIVEYALALQWQAWGLRPHAMIGYSLGEYVAACLAGVLSLEDSLALVVRRAALIERLPPGAMLAVMLPEPEVTALLEPALSLSAISGPELCVVAGPPEAVGALEQRLRARDVTVRRVRSSHAFHSKMMAPVADEVRAIMAGFTLHPPRVPYISNVTGAPITAAQATDPAYWAAHLCEPVRFAEGVRHLAGPLLLEVGPGQTLSSLAASASATPDHVLASMRHSLDPEPDTAVLLRAMGQLWIRGADVDWTRFPQAPLDVTGIAGEAGEGAELRWPTTRTEQDLAQLWQSLLRCDPPTLDSNFFALGGNSLVATRLIDQLSRTQRVKLPLRRIYEAATLEALAAAIDGRGLSPAGSAAEWQRGSIDERRDPKAGARGTRAARPAPAAAPPRPVARAAEDKPLLQLPNGLTVAHQNEAETRHFYDDIFAHRSYVKHGIAIPPGGCVLDVGGNIGLFTLFVHTEQPTARVLTFEPAPAMFAILSHNAARHGVRATLFNYGLSNRELDAPFTFYPHSAGMSSFHPDVEEERNNLRAIVDNQRRAGISDAGAVTAYTEELLDVRFAATTMTARLRRLSDVLREQAIAHVDLMKIDVQKCELEVIEGIDDRDWAKFSQIVLEAHDIDGRVATVRGVFERHGFSVIVEQDELYAGTNIHNIYARRRGS